MNSNPCYVVYVWVDFLFIGIVNCDVCYKKYLDFNAYTYPEKYKTGGYRIELQYCSRGYRCCYGQYECCHDYSVTSNDSDSTSISGSFGLTVGVIVPFLVLGLFIKCCCMHKSQLSRSRRRQLANGVPIVTFSCAQNPVNVIRTTNSTVNQRVDASHERQITGNLQNTYSRNMDNSTELQCESETNRATQESVSTRYSNLPSYIPTSPPPSYEATQQSANTQDQNLSSNIVSLPPPSYEAIMSNQQQDF